MLNWTRLRTLLLRWMNQNVIADDPHDGVPVDWQDRLDFWLDLPRERRWDKGLVIVARAERMHR